MNELNAMEGVFEQQATFFFRPTAGSLDVAEQANSDQALIKGVQGRSVSWNQLVQNGDFSDGTTGWTPRLTGNIQVNNSKLELIKKANNYNNSAIQTFVSPLPAGHKYYAKIDVDSIYNGFLLGLYGVYQSGGIYFLSGISASGQYSKVITARQSVLRLSFNQGNITVPPNIDDKLCTIDNVVVIDLTLIYGEGNEPTTAEQFEADYFAWFGKPLTYEAYTAGELRNLTMAGIKTQGFNLLNNSGKAQLIGGTQYQLTGTYTSITDGNGTAITPDAQGLFTPTESTEVTVSGVGSNTCLHFVHSGRRNGEYEEHWEETKEIDVTQIKGKLDGTGSSVLLAPNGLLQAGGVHDEIYFQDGKRWFAKRVGRVDLGTLNWTYRSNYQYFNSNKLSIPIKAPNSNEAVPIVCPIYRGTGDETTERTIDKVVWSGRQGYDYNATNNLIIRDLDYTDATVFKAAMSGVYLNYELATTEYYLLDDEWQDDGAWSYKVDAWGTEQVVSPAGGQSAPLDALIRYGSTNVKTLLVEFRDLKERLVQVSLEDQSVAFGYKGNLTPAAEPLTITEDDDHDPMLPIRSTVARIRVVSAYSDIIPVKNDLQWGVTIRRAGRVLWRGFLRTDIPTGNLGPTPSEVYYIADDVIGSLKAQRNELPEGKASLWNLLGFDASDPKFDDSLPTSTNGGHPSLTLRSLYVTPYNWMKEEDDVDGNPVDVPETADVVTGDILQFLGVCVRYWRDRLYVGGPFASGYWPNVLNKVALPLIDGSTLRWTGFHNVFQDQGYGQLRLEASGRAIESQEAPELADQLFDVLAIGYLPPQTLPATANGYNCYYRYLKPRADSGIEVFLPVGPAVVNFLCQMGGHIVDMDIWNDMEHLEDKANFNFQRFLILVGNDYLPDGAYGNKLPDFLVRGTTKDEAYATAIAQMKAYDMQPFYTVRIPQVTVNGGGFTLTLDVKTCTVGRYTEGGSYYRRIDSIDGALETAYSECLYSLRFGDKWWNGGEWQSEETRAFGLTSFMHTFVDGFQGTGLSFPVEGLMSGDVELNIFGFWRDVDTSTFPVVDFIPRSITLCAKVELRYNPPLDLYEVAKEDAYTIAGNAPDFPAENKKEVQLNLCSAGNVKDNWGWVFYGLTNKLETLYDPRSGEPTKPEVIVFERQRTMLCRARNYVTLSVEADYEDLPFSRISFLGRTWYPLAVKANLRKCSSELLLLDITGLNQN